MYKLRPVTLLMTATIKPPENCPQLLRTDPQQRLQDYCDALKFYLFVPDKIINNIVFVENSDSDLSALENIQNKIPHQKTVEFLSFKGGNNFPPEYGKGYGEMLIIDYAMRKSQLINRESLIWKATGRLMLMNIAELVKHAPFSYDLYCDLHSTYKMFKLEKFFDPRFYSFTMKGYNMYFAPHIHLLKRTHIESYFHTAILKAFESGDKNIKPRFKSQPVIKGIAGCFNDDYYTYKKRLQRVVQQAIRKLFPDTWL